MAKDRFSLQPAPTFKAAVQIPIPGGKPYPIEFTFRGRTKDEFRGFVEDLEGRDDVDVILDLASGWDLEDAFGRDSVTQLTQNYLGAARAVIEKYMTELTQARLGN